MDSTKKHKVFYHRVYDWMERNSYKIGTFFSLAIVFFLIMANISLYLNRSELKDTNEGLLAELEKEKAEKRTLVAEKTILENDVEQLKLMKVNIDDNFKKALDSIIQKFRNAKPVLMISDSLSADNNNQK